jgi:ABC-type microcin C transport system duplicated ATPase subunit YejF
MSEMATAHALTGTESSGSEQRRQSERRVAEASVLLTVRNLKMHFPVVEGALLARVVAHVKAIDGVSFTIR